MVSPLLRQDEPTSIGSPAAADRAAVSPGGSAGSQPLPTLVNPSALGALGWVVALETLWVVCGASRLGHHPAPRLPHEIIRPDQASRAMLTCACSALTWTAIGTWSRRT
jgi:hypothetical protein